MYDVRAVYQARHAAPINQKPGSLCGGVTVGQLIARFSLDFSVFRSRRHSTCDWRGEADNQKECIIWRPDRPPVHQKRPRAMAKLASLICAVSHPLASCLLFRTYQTNTSVLQYMTIFSLCITKLGQYASFSVLEESIA